MKVRACKKDRIVQSSIRIFDYPQFAATLRDTVRENAAKVAEAAGVAIEHISKSCLRKEDIVAKAIARRGEHPGLAHVISAMEACGAYEPCHDKKSHKTFVRPDSGKCLHYYFYFIHAESGLIYVRVPLGAVPFAVLLQRPQLAGAQANRRASGSRPGTTPSCALTIGSAPRNWPMASRLRLHRILTATRRYAARCSTPSHPITGLMQLVFHRSGLPLQGCAGPALRTTGAAFSAHREGADHRHIPLPEHRSQSGAGDLQPSQPGSRDLHQASVRQSSI